MNNKSPHILNTSSNLLGFTFVILSSIKKLAISQSVYLDKILALCVILFSLSCIFSFMSMRVVSEKNTDRFELIADNIFLVGLLIIAFTSILWAFNVTGFI